MRVLGVDFTSAPKRAKPIVVADCRFDERRLILERFLEFSDWPAYELWLGREEEWVGGFDFPFGLPRRFVEAQGWPADWPGMVRACVRGGKDRFVEEAMRAFRGARCAQDKHRRTDLVTGSHSPLKTRTNPPVGLMFYEGAWRLLASGVRVPGLRETGSSRIALEAYPGYLVSRLGERYYKNDKPSSRAANAAARKRIVRHLLRADAAPVPIPLALRTASLRARLMDASGDWLDAVLCAMQAAWGWERRADNFGLPGTIDACEGWIVSAPGALAGPRRGP